MNEAHLSCRIELDSKSRLVDKEAKEKCYRIGQSISF